MLRVVNVDKHGRDSEGNDFVHVATTEVVSKGLAVNVPVMLKYPDGRMEIANEVRITPKGLGDLRRRMGGVQ